MNRQKVDLRKFTCKFFQIGNVAVGAGAGCREEDNDGWILFAPQFIFDGSAVNGIDAIDDLRYRRPTLKA